MHPHQGICFFSINLSSSQDFSHMLWKTETAYRNAVGKACFDSIFCAVVFHRSKFSTGVDNFVENLRIIFFYIFSQHYHFFIYPNIAIIAAGVTPDIREASPIVDGRTLESFAIISLDNPPIL